MFLPVVFISLGSTFLMIYYSEYKLNKEGELYNVPFLILNFILFHKLLLPGHFKK